MSEQRNLKYMRAFAEAYPETEFVQRLVAQIPLKSNLTLIKKIPDATFVAENRAKVHV